MGFPQYNLIVLEISCFNGMAGSKRVRNLMEPLMKKHLIKVNNLIFKADDKDLQKKGILDGIRYEVISYRASNIFTVFPFFFKGLAFISKCKHSKCNNIIYNYGGPNIKNILFILFAKLIGYQIICDIVEDNRYEPKVGLMNNFKTKSSLILLKNSRHFANCLIGISDHLYKRLLDFSKNKIPVFIVPISVNLNFFKQNGYTPINNNLKIFYGGSFNEKDGLEYLIPAFDQISGKYNNISLVLTGYAVQTDMQKFQMILNKTVNKNKIFYKGFLKTNDYYKLLNSCDIFCMTRINSGYANAGFPFKLGEFLATGKAVIATTVGDVPKYLSNNINALMISPNSIEQIVDALSFVVENPDKIKVMGNEGRKVAEESFDSEKVSMKLYSIFQAI